MICKILKNLTVCTIFLCFFSLAPAFLQDSYKTYLNDYPHYLSSMDNENYLNVICTAYDLSYQSCEKYPDHPYYGITASGKSLKDHTRESAMSIAVDPNVIPLGSNVLIVFDENKHKKYTGIYKAVDTGSAIKGNKIDIFFGDEKENVSQETMEFGRVKAKAYVLN